MRSEVFANAPSGFLIFEIYLRKTDRKSTFQGHRAAVGVPTSLKTDGKHSNSGENKFTRC